MINKNEYNRKKLKKSYDKIFQFIWDIYVYRQK